MSINICEVCGESFEALRAAVRICPRCKQGVCEICGKSFTRQWPYTATTCSTECRVSKMRTPEMIDAMNKKRERTNMERYGVRVSSQIPGVGDKISASHRSAEFQSKFKSTMKERYGVTSPLQSEVIQSKFRHTMTERYGGQYSTQCVEIRRKIAKSNLDKFGYEQASKSEEVKAKARQTCQEKYGCDNPFEMSDFKAKAAATSIERYGTEWPAQSQQFKDRLRRTNVAKYGGPAPMCNPDIRRNVETTRFQKHADDGTRVDSGYELSVYNFLLRNNIPFEYQIPMKYEYDGKEHTTFIDFKIDGIYFEVKGSHMLDGFYDDQPGAVPVARKIELYKKEHVVVITDKDASDKFGKADSTESNGLKHLNVCPEPFIGVDISLFDAPVFPYSADRPPCFYDVRVNGNLSVKEAFHDEKIRWKMIVNRINYVGGFISNRSILTALNVTRTYKQPSWFSRSLAEHIISTYCTQDTIVDCFAGWGTRHDAAVKLGRKYVGIDFNIEAVKWHQANGRNIEHRDAKQFTYDDVCSVFICPPYTDPSSGECLEDYNYSEFDSSLTECDWLDIVRKNVPNATEYVVVCKNVRADYLPYIVDTKVNRSHLTTSNEYVLVVPGKLQCKSL